MRVESKYRRRRGTEEEKEENEYRRRGREEAQRPRGELHEHVLLH